jgi:hypothetical protein
MIEPMRYQVLYTRGGKVSPNNVCACEYVTARTHMEAWCKGTALAVGHERVAEVIPLT